VNTAVAVARTE